MGWYKSRTKLWFGDKAIIDYYKGIGDNSGFLYLDGTNGWTVAPSLQHDILISGISGTFERQNGCYFGKSWFKNSTWRLWYDGSTWILMNNPRFIGYIPSTAYEYDYNEDYIYVGDTFWTCNNFNEWAPDGTNAGTFIRYDDHSDTKTATSEYYHFKKKSNPNSYLGEYQNNEYCGYPVWKGNVDGIEHKFAKNANDEWWNLEHKRISYIGNHNLHTRVDGYIIPSLGIITDADTGFWISQADELPKFDSTEHYGIKKVRFVADDPEDPYSDGDLEDTGEYSYFVFDGFKESYYTSELGDTTQIWMAEGAIWR